MQLQKITVLLFAVLVAGCAGTASRTAPDKAELPAHGPGKPEIEGVSSPSDTYDLLTPNIIYHLLVGEIATQRRQLDLAYRHQLQSARLSQDAEAAERAARIALHQQDLDQALEAVKHWVEFAPDDAGAHQLAVILYLRADRLEPALEHLKRGISISRFRGQGGFLQAMVALTTEKDYSRVLELMRRLAADYPDDPQAGYTLALTALMVKRYEVAEKEIRVLLERSPGMGKAQVLLSRVLLARNDTEGAMRVLEEALKVSSEDELLRFAYARLLLDNNEPALAYQQFLKLRTLTPEAPNVHFSLGVLALEQGHLDEAREHLLQLIDLGKKRDEAAFYLGRIEALEERVPEALSWYRQVERGGLWIEAQIRVAYLLARQGEQDQAIDLLQQLRNQVPEHSVQLFLVEGEILQTHGVAGEAMVFYGEALESHPDEQDLLYARGLLAAFLGRIDVMERDLKKILQQEPGHANALNALGYTLADQTDRYPEALGYIERALALKPDAPAILDSMGWVQYRLGNLQEALRYLRKAFGIEQDAEIAAHLGEVLWVDGDKEEARKIWEEALVEEPESEYLQKVMRRLGEE